MPRKPRDTSKDITITLSAGPRLEPEQPQRDEKAIVETLQRCGEGAVRATIVYQKPGESWVTERSVEPYQFSQTAGYALIVQCWQCTPAIAAPCWRNFRVDRIVKAIATPQGFRPRVPVTLHTGEVEAFVFGDDPAAGASAPTVLERYSLMLHEVLAHLDLNAAQQAQLAAASSDLAPEQLRAVHGRFFSEALAEICADGRVTPDELDRLTAIRVWLTELGWCP